MASIIKQLLTFYFYHYNYPVHVHNEGLPLLSNRTIEGIINLTYNVPGAIQPFSKVWGSHPRKKRGCSHHMSRLKCIYIRSPRYTKLTKIQKSIHILKKSTFSLYCIRYYSIRPYQF